MTSHTFWGNIFCKSIDPGWNVNLLGGGFKFQICFWIFTPEKFGGNSIQFDLRIFFQMGGSSSPLGRGVTDYPMTDPWDERYIYLHLS